MNCFEIRETLQSSTVRSDDSGGDGSGSGGDGSVVVVMVVVVVAEAWEPPGKSLYRTAVGTSIRRHFGWSTGREQSDWLIRSGGD